jgi:hypothetical protein
VQLLSHRNRLHAIPGNTRHLYAMHCQQVAQPFDNQTVIISKKDFHIDSLQGVLYKW